MPLTDFPFEFGISLGTLRFLVVAHVLSAPKYDPCATFLLLVPWARRGRKANDSRMSASNFYAKA